ncbi:MAG TPA: hypothetical protein VGM31_23245 [Puia sp.]|jgi:hypothetical protein
MNKAIPVMIITNGEMPLCKSLAETINPPMAIQAPGNNNKPFWVGVKFKSRCAKTGVIKTDVKMPRIEKSKT